MTTQDLTTFTESGVHSPLFTVLSGSVTMNANTSQDAKLWKDFGAGHFGDFVHDDIDLNVTAVGQAFIVWAVSNVPGNRTELVAADGACWLEVLALGAGYKLTLIESVTTQNVDNSVELAFGTDYTIAVTRSNTPIPFISAVISANDVPVDTVILGIDGAFTFRDLTTAATRGASDGVVTLTTGAMDINEAPPRSRKRFRDRGWGVR